MERPCASNPCLASLNFHRKYCTSDTTLGGSLLAHCGKAQSIVLQQFSPSSFFSIWLSDDVWWKNRGPRCKGVLQRRRLGYSFCWVWVGYHVPMGEPRISLFKGRDTEDVMSLARCLRRCKSTPDLSYTAASLLSKVRVPDML